MVITGRALAFSKGFYALWERKQQSWSVYNSKKGGWGPVRYDHDHRFNGVFKASALWADAFYKSKCPSVCLSVRLFTFEVQFNGLFAPTS